MSLRILFFTNNTRHRNVSNHDSIIRDPSISRVIRDRFEGRVLTTFLGTWWQKSRQRETRPKYRQSMGTRSYEWGGLHPPRKARTRATKCTDVSKVAREIDEGPPVGVAKVAPIRHSLYAHGTCHVQRVFASKCAVEVRRQTKASLSTWVERGCFIRLELR